MNKLLAEFLGTLVFFYIALIAQSPIPIGIALIIAIMVFGPISGANFNPDCLTFRRAGDGGATIPLVVVTGTYHSTA